MIIKMICGLVLFKSKIKMKIIGGNLGMVTGFALMIKRINGKNLVLVMKI